MKRKKVCFQLLATVAFVFSGVVNAQVNTGSNLVEIGPDNVGGRVTSIVVDYNDATNQTIYAGAATGGLYVRSNDSQRAQYANMWNRVPCTVDGEQVDLPISSMVQGPDGTIYIATGEGAFGKSNKFSVMSAMGQGIFRFNPLTGALTRIPGTKPENAASPFASINKLAIVHSAGLLHLYAATNNGLYHWTVASESDWNNAPACYESNFPIYDVLAVQALDMVYFSTQDRLFRISDVSAQQPTYVDVYSSLPSTSASPCIVRMAVSPTDANYVYAMRINQDGLMEGVYLTTNHSTWSKLNSSTVTPITTNSGFTCGALCVDPGNAKRVFVGGSSIWSGQGYIDGQQYNWVKRSSSEFEFGSPNYMADIFSNAMFVHSGINQIVCTKQNGAYVYYIATDGGVFMSRNEMSSFDNISNGLNNIQVNGLAVANDGSLLIGAVNNANIFIESRMAHNGGRGIESWYDNRPELNTNHRGNVIWAGSGGQVAVSRFQQYAPTSRRNIFTSSSSMRYGRALGDYSDYSNTQTWTIDNGFLSDLVGTSYSNPVMALWESDNVTTSSDYITSVIDTLAFATRHRTSGDTLVQLRPGTQLLAGDEITVVSKAHADYPVTYVVPANRVIEYGDTIMAKNSIRNNLFIAGKKVGSMSSMCEVYMSWMPSDFRKVWYEHTSSTPETEEQKSEKMQWARVFSINVSVTDYTIGALAVSNDGDKLYIAVNDLAGNRSFIGRVSGIMNKVNYNGTVTEIKNSLSYQASTTKTTFDTLKINGVAFQPRCISSISVDPRQGTDHIIVTYQGEGTTDNVIDITAASTASPVATGKAVAGNVAAYCAMVEYTNGEVYVGTDDGIYVASASSYASTPSWNRYGSFNGIPVLAMCQQTNEMPVRHHEAHAGITTEKYVYARTKYPFAMYFGTYGRGVFMDSTYVTDHTNEIVDEADYVGVNTPVANGIGGVKLYPNPTAANATLQVSLNTAGSVLVRIFDINGKIVLAENLGQREGTFNYPINCQSFNKGMYMVQVVSNGGSSTSKLIVR